MKFRKWVLGVGAILVVVALVACQPGASAGNLPPGSATLMPGDNTEEPDDIPTEEPGEMETEEPDIMGTVTPGAGGTEPVGKTIYDENCSACHGSNGEGTTTAPALEGSTDVMDTSPDTIVQLVVNGTATGEHRFSDKLSDMEIAEVLTYVRAMWGDGANGVTESQVKDARSNSSMLTTPTP